MELTWNSNFIVIHKTLWEHRHPFTFIYLVPMLIFWHKGNVFGTEVEPMVFTLWPETEGVPAFEGRTDLWQWDGLSLYFFFLLLFLIVVLLFTLNIVNSFVFLCILYGVFLPVLLILFLFLFSSKSQHSTKTDPHGISLPPYPSWPFPTSPSYPCFS